MIRASQCHSWDWLRSRSHRAAISGLIVVLVLAVTEVAGAGISKLQERSVKAGFLINFVKFMQFPAGKHTGTTDPIIFAVSGDRYDEAILNKMLKEKKPVLNERKMTIKRISDPEIIKRVHVLFLPNDKELDLLGDASGSGALTVGNTDAFWKAGGIIQFVERNGKVRFRVNLKRAKEEKIKISSQLLRLAVEVKK